MKTIVIKFPYSSTKTNACGNVLWKTYDVTSTEAQEYVTKLRSMGYWASSFPECDGICFLKLDKDRKESFKFNEEEMTKDMETIFHSYLLEIKN